LNPLNTFAILSYKHYIVPKEITHIHAFSPKYKLLILFNSKNTLLAAGKNSTYKYKLLKMQNSICDVCKLTITEEQLLSASTHIHHVVPVFRKGSRDFLSNMMLLHS